MQEKLLFRWTRLYWIIKELKGSYQLGTLAGEIIGKWVNGFRLKPYKGPMPANPITILERDGENPDANTGDTRNLRDGTGKEPNPEPTDT